MDLILDEVIGHPYHEGLDVSLFEERWHFRRLETGSAAMATTLGRG